MRLGISGTLYLELLVLCGCRWSLRVSSGFREFTLPEGVDGRVSVTSDTEPSSSRLVNDLLKAGRVIICFLQLVSLLDVELVKSQSYLRCTITR